MHILGENSDVSNREIKGRVSPADITVYESMSTSCRMPALKQWPAKSPPLSGSLRTGGVRGCFGEV